MKNTKWIAWFGLAAAGAAAAALILSKKQPEGESAPAKKEGAKKAAPAAALKEGTYSFVSGYQDAATVEVTVGYDPEKFSFSVISEEYLNYSSDSHVAVLYGEDYHVQLEYAAYYRGEDFAALMRSAEEKYQGFSPAVYGDNQGFRYLDGDSFCFCFPIPGDEHSYILLSAIRVQADPEDFAVLYEDPAFSAMLGSIRFRLRR